MGLNLVIWEESLKYVDLRLHLGEKLVLHLTGQVLCPPCWFALSWCKGPVLHSKSAIFLYCSQLWGRFESGVLLDVDTVASLLPFLWLLLLQCLNRAISRSVRLWRSADRIHVLSLPCRMVRKQHLTYCQVGVSLPSLLSGVKSTFNVLQFKAVNSRSMAILLKSYVTPPIHTVTSAGNNICVSVCQLLTHV